MRIYFLLLFLIPILLPGQNTITINGQSSGPALKKVGLNLPFHCYYIDQNTQWITPAIDGSFSFTAALVESQFAFLRLENQWIKIYLEPGDTLEVRIDAENQIAFSNKLGALNNLLQTLNCSIQIRDLNERWLPEKDPVGLWQTIEESKTEDLRQLNDFAQEHPDASPWIDVLKTETDYFHRARFYDIGHRHAYVFPIDSTFDKSKWLEIADEQFDRDDLQHEAALSSIGYYSWLNHYFDWEQRRILDPVAQMNEAEQMTYLEQLFGEDPEELLPRLRRDQFELLFKQMIYQKILRGPVLEKMLAGNLYTTASFQYFETIDEAYRHFQDLFPGSRYKTVLEPQLRPILDRQAEVEDEKQEESYLFLEAEAEGWDSLSQVLQTYRGKVILIDLWFSTCGPCREEFVHLPELKAKFAGQDLVNLYISTDNPARKKAWQETARYFKLEGKHILGNQTFLEDIWQQLPSPRYTYPRYVLVDRQGRIVDPNAPLPSEKERLYQAITQLLSAE